MRIYRLEVPAGVGEYQPFRPVLRATRHGAFATGVINSCFRLYDDIPAPPQDFPDLDYNPDFFFGFSSLEKIQDYLDEIPAVCVIAVYEVEPIRESQFQVVFHRNTARFQDEFPVNGVETGINEHIWGVMS